MQQNKTKIIKNIEINRLTLAITFNISDKAFCFPPVCINEYIRECITNNIVYTKRVSDLNKNFTLLKRNTKFGVKTGWNHSFLYGLCIKLYSEYLTNR